MENKKLYKSINDRMIFGVCGGIAEYFNIDTTIVGLLWVVITLFVGFGVPVYIICILLMPDRRYV